MKRIRGNPRKCLRGVLSVISPGCPGLSSGGRNPRALDLDLEQLLKNGSVPAWALLRRTPGETRRRPPPTCSPGCPVPMTSHGPRFYTNHLSLSFISLIEVVSSGSFYAVFTAPHLSAPRAAVPRRRRGRVPEHRQWPCRRSGATPTRSPPLPVSMRYLSLPVHTMCHYILHLYFGITLFCRLALL